MPILYTYVARASGGGGGGGIYNLRTTRRAIPFWQFVKSQMDGRGTRYSNVLYSLAAHGSVMRGLRIYIVHIVIEVRTVTCKSCAVRYSSPLVYYSTIHALLCHVCTCV